MRTVIQRVNWARVVIDGALKGEIGQGFMVLVGIAEDDAQEDIDYIVKKTVNLRLFDDENGVMNINIKDAGGEILLISQFTLMAQTAKGNRPSYIKAARPEISLPIYEKVISSMEQALGKRIQTGTFGADMKVSLENNGPVTIVIDSKNKE